MAVSSNSIPGLALSALLLPIELVVHKTRSGYFGNLHGRIFPSEPDANARPSVVGGCVREIKVGMRRREASELQRSAE